MAVRALCGTAFVALLLVAVCGCTEASLSGTKGARHSVDLKIGEESDGKEIALKVGQVFTLDLPENPTTGFVWKFVSAGGVEQNGAPGCSKLSDTFIPPAGSSLGSPGTHEWRFRADEPGTAVIQMRLLRRWDADSATRPFSLRLRVT